MSVVTRWSCPPVPPDPRVGWLLYVYEEGGEEALWQMWLHLMDPDRLCPALRNDPPPEEPPAAEPVFLPGLHLMGEPFQLDYLNLF